MPAPVVVLVGPPGAGKTTVAALLADRLGVTVRDTDDDVVAAHGAPIGDLFVDHGEAWFRVVEAETVATALREHDGVLALGGGAVTTPETRAALRGHRVVHLDLDLTTAVARVGLGTSRPLLLGNVRGQLKMLLDQRRPVYAEVAWRTVGTVDRTADQVADEIVTLLDDAPAPTVEETR